MATPDETYTETGSLNTELIDVLLGYIRSLSQVISEQRARIEELEA